MFQFYYSSINTGEILALTNDNNDCFNSTIVRLTPIPGVEFTFEETGFNSTIVRLTRLKNNFRSINNAVSILL